MLANACSATSLITIFSLVAAGCLCNRCHENSQFYYCQVFNDWGWYNGWSRIYEGKKYMI